jgi:hypothetical protein
VSLLVLSVHEGDFPDIRFSDADQFTTVDDIVQAVVKILEDTSIVGKAVEVSKGKTYHREQHEYCDEAQEKTMGSALTSF